MSSGNFSPIISFLKELFKIMQLFKVNGFTIVYKLAVSDHSTWQQSRLPCWHFIFMQLRVQFPKASEVQGLKSDFQFMTLDWKCETETWFCQAGPSVCSNFVFFCSQGKKRLVKGENEGQTEAESRFCKTLDSNVPKQKTKLTSNTHFLP